MSDIAIKVENLSKAYQLGDFTTGTLSRDIERWWATIRRKEDPFLKIGETNDRATKGSGDVVWSLRDINFEIKKGDAVGIIGRNGAGKSTLLKLLSRVTSPTTGDIRVKGRIASLLEVGTGFHPELTGRENIFLNGAILGMRKNEIRKQFDAIVDFAGIDRYIDTPVKRYSSGMYVRLAFAVSAYLESETLIVDEVLAVGDAEFQKKCLGKMGQASKNEGRTILFVSHNLSSIMSLCEKGIYLKNGEMLLHSGIYDAVKAYAADKDTQFSKEVKIFSDNKRAWLSGFKMVNDEGNDQITMKSAVTVKIEVEAIEEIKGIFIGVGINDVHETRLFTLFSRFYNRAFDLKVGQNLIICELDKLNLKPGLYKVEVFIGNDQFTLDYYNHGLQIEIFPSVSDNHLVPDSSQGSIFINQNWL
jgi:lipopolysaccharide transport system ATP-binding protein